MIRDFQLFPLDRCCDAWGESLCRDAIRLNIDGYCVTSSAQHLSNCPFCGGDKQGRTISLTSLTT